MQVNQFSNNKCDILPRKNKEVLVLFLVTVNIIPVKKSMRVHAFHFEFKNNNFKTLRPKNS